jgi:tetratricopeptide (TPR) repeat protein
MDKSTLLRLIDEPNLISETDLESLEEMAATYPYFQITHLLIAKYTQDKESMLAPQKIRRAASYAYDRNQLRVLIQSNGDKTNGNSNIKLKTHFEPIDSDAPKMISTFEEVENFETVKPNKEEDDTNTTSSFFDVIEEEDSDLKHLGEDVLEDKENILSPNNELEEEDSKDVQESVDTSFFDEINTEDTQEEEDIPSPKVNFEGEPSEKIALDFFHDGKIEGAEEVFKQLVQINPQKASYYYKQLAILTDKPEYLTLAEENEPKEDEEVAPFFENIPEASLSETETLINQSSESTSFFEGIGSEDDINTSEISREIEEDTISSDDLQEENESINLSKVENTYKDNISFFDEIEEDVPDNSFFEETEANTDKVYNLDSLIAAPIQKAPNQVTEDTSSFFAELEALDDIHIVERVADDTDPFEELKRKSSDVSETEEPFVFKPESKPDTSFSNQIEDKNQPPLRQSQQKTEELSEEKAVYFFNEGKNKKAIEIYEQLLEKNPQKASYYISQINVIKSQEAESKPSNTSAQPNTEANVSNFKVTEEETGLSERLAIQLFNEGKQEEAVAIYIKLRERETRLEKKMYYDQQIEILKS